LACSICNQLRPSGVLAPVADAMMTKPTAGCDRRTPTTIGNHHKQQPESRWAGTDQPDLQDSDEGIHHPLHGGFVKDVRVVFLKG